MNILDIIIAIPLLWFLYKGFTKGLIIELATLLALLTGIYIAIHFSNYTADFLRAKFGLESEYMSIIAFAITFLGVILLVILFGKTLEKLINIMMLSFLNKITGAVFGLLKTAFILSVLILILSNFDLENTLIKPEMQEKSLLYHPIKKIAPATFPILKKHKDKLMEELEVD